MYLPMSSRRIISRIGSSRLFFKTRTRRFTIALGNRLTLLEHSSPTSLFLGLPSFDSNKKSSFLPISMPEDFQQIRVYSVGVKQRVRNLLFGVEAGLVDSSVWRLVNCSLRSLTLRNMEIFQVDLNIFEHGNARTF